MASLSLTRRGVLTGACALGLAGRASASPVHPGFAAIEQRVGGRLGVCAFHAGAGRWLTYRGREQFALSSTFKWLLAAAILERADSGALPLNTQLPFTEADLLEHAPQTRARLRQGSISVADACEAAVTESDNTASNLLLAKLEGPAGFTEWLKARAHPDIRLDRLEPDLNQNLPGDPRDTTTPEAMISAMRRILIGRTAGGLSLSSRERLIGWMVQARTGLTRLSAGLPQHWRVGDKTGTAGGPNPAVNDVAIAWPPGRAPILIACYLSDFTGDADLAHQDVARIVAKAWG